MKLFASNFFKERFWQWADKRRPVSNQHLLNRHSLFIFPSRQGLWFLVVDLLLWLLGTNFSNNLVLALAFLLVTIFIVSILHTFANLSGIDIQILKARDVFSGEIAEFPILIKRQGKRSRYSIQLRWGTGDPTLIDLAEDQEVLVNVFAKTSARGRFDPGPLIVETNFPLGIIRCWTRLRTSTRVIVYPHPIVAGPLPKAQSLNDDGTESTKRGADEFGGYKAYQPGDSLKNVAWKQVARGMDVHVKEYTAFVDHRLWLDWDYLHDDSEKRLSKLCYWVLEANGSDQLYGVRLPGVEIEPGNGVNHREQSLRALALFGREQLGNKAFVKEMSVRGDSR